MTQDRAVVVMKRQYELVCDLLNGIFTLILNNRNIAFKVTLLFDAEYNYKKRYEIDIQWNTIHMA